MKDLVEIELGGKTRHLRFDFNAAALAEQEMSRFWGKKTTIDSVREELGKRLVSTADLRALLWAGLYHEDITLTIEAVGKMIESETLAETFGKVWTAINRHLLGVEVSPFPTAAKGVKKKTASEVSGRSPEST